MKRGLSWALPCLLLMVGVSACRTVAILNVNGDTYSPSPSASAADVTQAIKRAGEARGWNIEMVGPGEMKGTLNVRKHVAVVAITYDMKSFSINYVSSQNLMQSGNNIHRNYNRWVNNLAADIRREVSLL
jgi:hypothetical protein